MKVQSKFFLKKAQSLLLLLLLVLVLGDLVWALVLSRRESWTICY